MRFISYIFIFLLMATNIYAVNMQTDLGKNRVCVTYTVCVVNIEPQSQKEWYESEHEQTMRVASHIQKEYRVQPTFSYNLHSNIVQVKFAYGYQYQDSHAMDENDYADDAPDNNIVYITNSIYPHPDKYEVIYHNGERTNAEYIIFSSDKNPFFKNIWDPNFKQHRSFGDTYKSHLEPRLYIALYINDERITKYRNQYYHSLDGAEIEYKYDNSKKQYYIEIRLYDAADFTTTGNTLDGEYLSAMESENVHRLSFKQIGDYVTYDEVLGVYHNIIQPDGTVST